MADRGKDVQKKEADMTEGIERTRSRDVYLPGVDILERRDDIVLTADMPGVDQNSVDITLEKRVLTITGNVDNGMSDECKLYSCEYGTGDYQRSFTLSDEIDREKIEAKVHNGVLELILPKAEVAKTKKIKVKAG